MNRFYFDLFSGLIASGEPGFYSISVITGQPGKTGIFTLLKGFDMRRLAMASVLVALTANQSFAGCGLFSKLFGNRRPAVQQCQQAPVQYVQPVAYSAPVPTVSSCPNGQCPNQNLQVTPRGFRLFK
jgi:hypothetical protein